MSLAYRCAISPLDQSRTGIGWLPGFYSRTTCGLADTCNWWDETLQFLADPGSPVVAPVPVRVLSANPLIVLPTIPWTDTFGRTSHWGDPSSGDMIKGIRIRGVTPAVASGATLQKGDLLGRIAPRERGTKWSLWDPTATPLAPRGQDTGGIVAFFNDLGLFIVGNGPQDVTGFDRAPTFGGHLLARTGGVADCTASSSVHGLDGYLGYLGTGADYVPPDSSVYSRYGTSSQTDTAPPTPSHENLSPAVAGAAAGGGLLLLGGLGLGLWWLSRR